MLDLMNRPKYNVMTEDNQNNNDPVITSKSIDLAEILDEGIDHQVNTHPLRIPLTKTRRSPSSRGSRSRRHRHSRRRRSRSRRDSRSARRRRDSSEEERRSRSKKREDEHRSSKDRRRRDSSSPSKEQETEQQAEVGNQSKSSQPVQSKAMGPQQGKQPPLPPPDTAPTSASSASTLQTQAGTVPQPSVQQSHGHVAQAVPTVPTHYPMAKAVPLHQSQGHVPVAAQPDPRPMPTRQAQGQVQLMQPLPQPLYPPQQQLIAVSTQTAGHSNWLHRQVWVQVKKRNQAAHIQQMERELALLRAQLQATQPQVPSRQSSHSPDGWGWDQSTRQPVARLWLAQLGVVGDTNRWISIKCP